MHSIPKAKKCINYKSADLKLWKTFFPPRPAVGKTVNLDVVKDSFFSSTSEFSVKLGFHVKILISVDFNSTKHRYVLTNPFSSDLMETMIQCAVR